jgi:hypothetical protein
MDTDKYYSWKSLKRISKYGIKTKNNSAASTAASTSAGSTSDSDSKNSY